ncbi:cobyric acid synthase [Vulcanisaeta thermophila]|uniref:cobyric acid synthase n=1 Tax=Vulcanisaeta thermophila TaxID=867917 RepID=UPI0008538618|nr:cobyric acid synthase [Vulcanisaeta thermophila]
MHAYIVSTMSDSGKTTLVAGLIRLAVNKGLRTAPFKAQNMSLNSYPAIEGGEIALAQAMQSYVAGVKPSIYFNPVLIKPMGEDRAEYVVLGKPRKQITFGDYLRDARFRALVIRAIKGSIKRLINEYDLVIGEGAGSAYEPNLAPYDLANFRPAQWLGANVYVVLDIDRGGAFTQGLGLMNSLPSKWRGMVRGFIINKFRGDERLLRDAVKWLEDRTGKPVLGVIPYINDLILWPEDSMDLKPIGNGPLDIALIAYPYISNFNDIYPLAFEGDVTVRIVRSPMELGEPHMIILPGSKNVVASVEWLRRTGLDKAIKRLVGSSVILGICGGFQALSKKLSDPTGIEAGAPGHYHGLGLIDLEVEYGVEKITALSRAVVNHGGIEGAEIRGYEIHRGIIKYTGSTTPFITIIERNNRKVNIPDGVLDEGRMIVGITLHDSLGNPEFRTFILNLAREIAGLPKQKPNNTTSITALINQIDKLATTIKNKIDVEYIINL